MGLKNKGVFFLAVFTGVIPRPVWCAVNRFIN